MFLDFTPIAYQYESPIAGATLISKTVKEQLGFTVNIGIAPNKLLAKMASDFEKPDRIHTLWKEEIPKKLWPLPIEDLYMVGKSSSTRLRSLGITTIGELAHTDKDFLMRELKAMGCSCGNMPTESLPQKSTALLKKLKGVGNSTTLAQDVSNADDAKKVLLCLSGTGLFETPKVQSACTVRNRGDQVQHVSTYFAPEGAALPRTRPSRSMSFPVVF